MKQFFKFLFASMLGTILAVSFMFTLLLIVVFGLISSSEKNNKTEITSNSILKLDFDKPIKERSSKEPFENFTFKNFSAGQEVGLNDILKAIREAKKDKNIKGIYFEPELIKAGIGSIEEIRNALTDFKTSGKFVISYSETYSQMAYYLASCADQVYLNPQGSIDIKGLRTELMFFKGSLQKLEIEPEIIRHGRFKSAVEPFILEKMSPENKKQLSELINEVWDHISEEIAKSRKIPVSEFKKISSEFLVKNAATSVRFKITDKLLYKDEVLALLKDKSGQKNDKSKLKLISVSKYLDSENSSKDKKFIKEKIAVIYATGQINDGKGDDDDQVYSENLSETIRKARLDDDVKAVVLRVNSPGGSALASDVIWRELKLIRKVKPVVVSMGDVAASGGYYISCGANKVYAEPTTITGSIGVFGVLFNLKNFLNNKLGITIDTLKTGKYSNLGSPFWPVTASEKALIQESVEAVYDTFITRVSAGRNISKAMVDSIGQGRVWNAFAAKRIKLIDEIGGIETAIKSAAELAKLKEYGTLEMPLLKEPFQKIMDQLTGNKEDQILSGQLGAYYHYVSRLKGILKMSRIQARIPYEIEMY